MSAPSTRQKGKEKEKEVIRSGGVLGKHLAHDRQTAVRRQPRGQEDGTKASFLATLEKAAYVSERDYSPGHSGSDFELESATRESTVPLENRQRFRAVLPLHGFDHAKDIFIKGSRHFDFPYRNSVRPPKNDQCDD